MSGNERDWSSLNYFNYFTEVEEHFQRARGTGLFLLSPLDWALIEGWKNSGVPLEAVLRGIDLSFEHWRSKKSKTRAVNSLAFCTQEVLGEAQKMEGLPEPVSRPDSREALCTVDELRAFLERNAAKVKERGEGYTDIAESLARLAADAAVHYEKLEELDQRLTILEEKMLAVARSKFTEDDLLESRRELANQLRPYRGRMTADQLKMVEKQFLDRRDFERSALPRLSLFYLR